MFGNLSFSNIVDASIFDLLGSFFAKTEFFQYIFMPTYTHFPIWYWTWFPIPASFCRTWHQFLRNMPSLFLQDLPASHLHLQWWGCYPCWQLWTCTIQTFPWSRLLSDQNTPSLSAAYWQKLSKVTESLSLDCVWENVCWKLLISPSRNSSKWLSIAYAISFKKNQIDAIVFL